MNQATTWDVRPQRPSRSRFSTSAAVAVVAALLAVSAQGPANAQVPPPEDPVEPYVAGNAVVFFDEASLDAFEACIADGGTIDFTVDGESYADGVGDLLNAAGAESALEEWEVETSQTISEFEGSLPADIVGALRIFWASDGETDSDDVGVVELTCVVGSTTLTYTFIFLGTGFSDLNSPPADIEDDPAGYAAIGFWYAVATVPAPPPPPPPHVGTVSDAPVPTSIPAGEGSSSGGLPLAGVMLAFAGAMVARRRRAGAAA